MYTPTNGLSVQEALEDEDVFPKATTNAAIATLLGTILGAGVLSLPYVFKICGVGLGVVIFVVIGAFNVYTLNLLFETCYIARRVVGRYELITFAKVGELAYGLSGRFITLVCVVLLTYMAVLAYFISLGDILPDVIAYFSPHLTETWYAREVTLSFVFCVVCPLSWVRRITTYWPLAAFSCLSIALVGAFIILRGIQMLVEVPSEIPQVDVVWVNADVNAFSGLAIIAVSFACHFNVFPVFSEMKDGVDTRVVSSWSIFLSSLLYTVVGLFGYLQFREDTQGNILLNYEPGDTLMLISRIGLSVMLLMSIVLVGFPCRRCLCIIIWNDRKTSRLEESFVSTTIIVSCFGLSLVFSQLEQIWSLAGATVGGMVTLVIPGLFWLKLKKRNKCWTDSAAKTATCLLVVAIVVVVLATFSSIRDFVLSPPQI